MQGLSKRDARYSRRTQWASQRRRSLEVHVIAKVPQMDGGSPPETLLSADRSLRPSCSRYSSIFITFPFLGFYVPHAG
jgi:hypothetical protein